VENFIQLINIWNFFGHGKPVSIKAKATKREKNIVNVYISDLYRNDMIIEVPL
jgi:hypothetical protein